MTMRSGVLTRSYEPDLRNGLDKLIDDEDGDTDTEPSLPGDEVPMEEDNRDPPATPMGHPNWYNDHVYMVDMLLSNVTRNVELIEIKRSLRTYEAICLFRFAVNFKGTSCAGLVYGGICTYHWQCMNIGFCRVSSRVLDNVNDGSSKTYHDKVTPYFTNVLPKATLPIAPIVRSISRKDLTKNKEKIISLMSSCFGQTTKTDEAEAMAKGLLAMITCTESPIFTIIRNQWIANQMAWVRGLNPKTMYQLIDQSEGSDKHTVSFVTVDQLTIFDTPLLLILPTSAVVLEDKTQSFSDPANVTMIQLTNKKVNVGVFAICGPIIYAPVIGGQQNSSGGGGGGGGVATNEIPTIPRQHLMTYAKLGGVSHDTRSVVLPMVLSNLGTAMIDLTNTSLISNEDLKKCTPKFQLVRPDPEPLPLPLPDNTQLQSTLPKKPLPGDWIL